MKTLSIAIGTDDRRCVVDAAELAAWSRRLIDDVLLEAAKAAGERDGPFVTLVGSCLAAQ